MPCIHCCSSSVVWMSMCVPQDLGFVLERGSLLEGTGTIGIRVIRPKSINRCAVVLGMESPCFQSPVLLPSKWIATSRVALPKDKIVSLASQCPQWIPKKESHEWHFKMRHPQMKSTTQTHDACACGRNGRLLVLWQSLAFFCASCHARPASQDAILAAAW